MSVSIRLRQRQASGDVVLREDGVMIGRAYGVAAIIHRLHKSDTANSRGLGSGDKVRRQSLDPQEATVAHPSGWPQPSGASSGAQRGRLGGRLLAWVAHVSTLGTPRRHACLIESSLMERHSTRSQNDGDWFFLLPNCNGHNQRHTTYTLDRGRLAPF
jgi:hypothetical protein